MSLSSKKSWRSIGGTKAPGLCAKSGLCVRISAVVAAIDFSRYKDSMSPLIKKDAEELLKMMDY